MNKLTDKGLRDILEALDQLNQSASGLVRLIEESDHPNAEEVVAALRESNFDNPADAIACWDGYSE